MIQSSRRGAMSSAPRILVLDQAEFVPWCGNSKMQGLIVNGGADKNIFQNSDLHRSRSFLLTHILRKSNGDTLFCPLVGRRHRHDPALGVQRGRTRRSILEDLLKKRAIDKGMVELISSSPRPTIDCRCHGEWLRHWRRAKRPDCSPSYCQICFRLERLQKELPTRFV
jgi:hypothetical protein